MAVLLTPIRLPASALFQSQSRRISVSISRESRVPKSMSVPGRIRSPGDDGSIEELTYSNRQVKEIDLVSGTKNKGMLDGVFQLSYVGGPVVIYEDAHGRRQHALDVLAALIILVPDKMVCQ